MTRVLHLITGLDTGGAEMMLAQLLPELDRVGFAGEVVSLTAGGVVARRMVDGGVEVSNLGMPPGVPDPRGLGRLVARLRARPPELMQTWLYHADLLGGLAGRLVGVPVVWGVHVTRLDQYHVRRRTLLTARACARLSSRLPARIVCCSQSACEVHRALGYDSRRSVVIDNGIDTDAFAPNANARAEVREELRVGAAPLIGMMARFERPKDHLTFVRAAGRLVARRPDARFVLGGRGCDRGNRELGAWLRTAGVTDQTSLLGHRDDVPRVLAALDVATLISESEALPLAIGEGMSAGVPCVASDVGDCARLIGDTGSIVPVGDDAAVAAAWQQMLALTADERAALGAAARARIVENFSLPYAASRYAALYRNVLDAHTRAH